MIKTPELDKQQKIIESGASSTLTDFYDFLRAKGYEIVEWQESLDEDDQGNLIEEVNLKKAYINPEELFAEFFGIDLRVIEQERRAILYELRIEV